jgi:Dullard-like phosphatase family protein
LDYDKPYNAYDDRFKEAPNNKPREDSFTNAKREILKKENSNIFEPAFGVYGEGNVKRIDSIVKLINARDPPNKYFDSTVNFMDDNVWKRRSIYMTKAQMNLDPSRSQHARHTVLNSGHQGLTLSREDSGEDDFWDNTDEGIGEYDRVIPVVAIPKWLSALKDKYLPPGIQKMLKQSTRFSYSFHVTGDSLKKNKSDSDHKSRKGSKIGKRYNVMSEEEKQNLIERGKQAKKFFGYQQFTDVKSSDPEEFTNQLDYEEEQWIREKTLRHKKDDLKQLENNTVFKKWDFKNEDKDEASLVNQSSCQRDSCIDKIEEIDNKKKALSEVSLKPKKNLNSMVSKVASPFEVAPNVNKEQSKRFSLKENNRNHSSSMKNERESVDVWRASRELDKDMLDDQISKPETNSKEEIIDQWLRSAGRNNTITEDVDAENAEESSRMTRSSGISVATKRISEPLPPQEEEEEEENELHKMHMLQSLQALHYMKTVEVPSLKEIEHMWIFLPPPKQPHLTKTLIFDMDETLIHCVDDIEEERPQVVLDVAFDDGEVVQAGINIRPYARECLKAANELFQVIVFTASHKWYADVVLNHLDPTGELIHYRLYRDSWYKTDDNVYIKDLRIIQNREMCDIVIVDNAVYSFGFQLDNGIPIIPYYEDPDDEELFHLIPYLEILAEGDDVRLKNREAFQLREMAKENQEETDYFDN